MLMCNSELTLVKKTVYTLDDVVSFIILVATIVIFFRCCGFISNAEELLLWALEFSDVLDKGGSSSIREMGRGVLVHGCSLIDRCIDTILEMW